jgi:hypothetical protein
VSSLKIFGHNADAQLQVRGFVCPEEGVADAMTVEHPLSICAHML